MPSGRTNTPDGPLQGSVANRTAALQGADDATTRRRLLDEFGIEIGAGLGELAGKVWRIGLMGRGSRPENVDRVLQALASILDRKAA